MQLKRFWTLALPLLLAALAPVPFANAEGVKAKPRLAILFADNEYHNDQAIKEFAEKYLSKDFDWDMISWDKYDGHKFVGIEKLNDADVLMVSARRRILPKEQLAMIRKWVADGKPVVGIRTASHAFCGRPDAKKKETPAGADEWPEFDHDVLGGSYHGHFKVARGSDNQTLVKVIPDAKDHPILSGMPLEEFVSVGTLYQCSPLGAKTTALVTGRNVQDESSPPEPVAWTNTHSGGGRVFFTSLGHIEDFKQPAFVRLLRNGIYWASGKDVPGDL